MEKHG
jgi:hypothetical protein